MTLRWLPEAIGDIDRIDAFWRAIDPALAARAAASILDLADSLQAFPERGRASQVGDDTRELVKRFGAGSFILRYRQHGGDLIVVQVRHSRERPPWM